MNDSNRKTESIDLMNAGPISTKNTMKAKAEKCEGDFSRRWEQLTGNFSTTRLGFMLVNQRGKIDRQLVEIDPEFQVRFGFICSIYAVSELWFHFVVHVHARAWPSMPLDSILWWRRQIIGGCMKYSEKKINNKRVYVENEIFSFLLLFLKFEIIIVEEERVSNASPNISMKM